jgi:hypothetical protein
MRGGFSMKDQAIISGVEGDRRTEKDDGDRHRYKPSSIRRYAVEEWDDNGTRPIWKEVYSSTEYNERPTPILIHVELWESDNSAKGRTMNIGIDIHQGQKLEDVVTKLLVLGNHLIEYSKLLEDGSMSIEGVS